MEYFKEINKAKSDLSSPFNVCLYFICSFLIDVGSREYGFVCVYDEYPQIRHAGYLGLFFLHSTSTLVRLPALCR